MVQTLGIHDAGKCPRFSFRVSSRPQIPSAELSPFANGARRGENALFWNLGKRSSEGVGGALGCGAAFQDSEAVAEEGGRQA